METVVPTAEANRGSESQSRSVVSDSFQPHGLYSPWNFPGQNTGVGSLSLLQGVFPTQGSNPGLLHGRQILTSKWVDVRTVIMYHPEPCLGITNWKKTIQLGEGPISLLKLFGFKHSLLRWRQPHTSFNQGISWQLPILDFIQLAEEASWLKHPGKYLLCQSHDLFLQPKGSVKDCKKAREFQCMSIETVKKSERSVLKGKCS